MAQAAEPGSARAILTRSIGTALLTALYVSFAWSHWIAFRATHRPSLVFAVVTETLLAGFIVARRPAAAASLSPWAWLTSLGGTFSPLFLRPMAGAHDQLAGTVIQLVGAIATVAGILSLQRSFGLLPAHRGIRRAGMYRLVRHPLYSAYTVSGVGYLVNHPTVRNLVLVVVGLGFQVARLRNEEQLLSRDPDYLAYKAETRWRLFPLVF